MVTGCFPFISILYMRRIGRSSLVSKAKMIRNGKVVRSKSQAPHLRCPMCKCVWTSDWNGLCSHVDCVHNINLQDFSAVKPLLELRAQKMSAINRVAQGEKCEAINAGDEFREPNGSLWSETFFQLDETLSKRNVTRPNEGLSKHQSSLEIGFYQSPVNARREVRSLSDFGIRSDMKHYPVRERSVSVTRLNSPQLESLYESYRRHNTAQQLRTRYEQMLQDKGQILLLVLPAIVREIAEIDYEVDKSLIGSYAL
ncbi:hypothetical protein BIW11_12601 [Tropilaelaps mercedesae]|uniref:Uncharacterized protein n=1 Tax=Tropilaelaps mercedesae TaxID=418985 RepID=A0A1V9X5Z0_9ACAR|nr:hypothetical protein BIW11_12601 [Tropilaelaps mercedesae]